MYSNIIILPHKNTVHKLPFSLKELQKILYAMLLRVEQSQKSIELTLLTDAEMEILYKKELLLTAPTNILSFSAIDENHSTLFSKNKAKNVLLGSLALSVDTLIRECFLYQQNIEEHCIRLLAHGMAHLLGYDHGEEMDALCERLEATYSV